MQRESPEGCRVLRRPIFVLAVCQGQANALSGRSVGSIDMLRRWDGMAGRIPATIVTGFLGSGKTTLIRHLLNHADGRRIALIVNEFGDLGVDGSILQGCGLSDCVSGIVELSNGCICCAVAEEFAPAMLELIERDIPPEHIMIETSGLALPQPLVRAFNWPQLRGKVTVDGVITVIDGPALSEGRFANDHHAVESQRRIDDSLDHDTPIAELFEDQLACADMAIITKSDLLDRARMKVVSNQVEQRTGAGVSVIVVEQGCIDPRLVLGLSVRAEESLTVRDEAYHGHDEAHHDHDSFETFVATLPEARCSKNLVAGIEAMMKRHHLLRIKGFAAVKGRPMRLVVQAVGPRVSSYFDQELTTAEKSCTRLVVIGEAGLDQDAILRDLSSAIQ